MAVIGISSKTAGRYTLVTTSFNDERVPAWNAFKLAAALQAAQSCDRPIVLRADQGGGHSVTAQNWQSSELDILTFAARSVRGTRILRSQKVQFLSGSSNSAP